MATPSESYEVKPLLRTLLAVAADIHLRSLSVRAKCDELERVLAYVDRVRQARARTQEAAQCRQEAAHVETRNLESSIGEAIRRARQIRLHMSENQDTKQEEEEDTKADDDGVGAASLERILNQARGVKRRDQAHDRGDATDRSEMLSLQQQQQQSDPQPQSYLAQSMPQAVRLEYPRRMKTLMDQLDDMMANDREQPFRVAFCRKMTEHLSMRERGRIVSDANEMVRVQVSFPVQLERLQVAYRRLGQYMDVRANPQSEAIQKALQTPSMSSVFPVYSRLKQARRMLSHLNNTTTGLAHRIPPRPSLSQEAMAHRDAVIERFRKKSPSQKEATACASNRLLLMRNSTSDLHAHGALLEKLQAAWDRNEESHPTSDSHQIKIYENAIDETILSEISTLVLSAFQAAFCDGEQAPSQATVRELMGVIRVAESAVVFKGRRQRSVVQ